MKIENPIAELAEKNGSEFRTFKVLIIMGLISSVHFYNFCLKSSLFNVFIKSNQII